MCVTVRESCRCQSRQQTQGYDDEPTRRVECDDGAGAPSQPQSTADSGASRGGSVAGCSDPPDRPEPVDDRRSGDRARRARAGVRDRPHGTRRGGPTESTGDGRRVRGGAHGEPGHRRGDRRPRRSRWRGAQAHPLPRGVGSHGHRGGQPGRRPGRRDEVRARHPIPGAGDRRGRTGSGRAVDRYGHPGPAPGLARRAAGRPADGGDRLSLRGLQRRPSSPGGRAVVRCGPGPHRRRLSQRQCQWDRRWRGQRR